jgi:hypothetical protein
VGKVPHRGREKRKEGRRRITRRDILIFFCLILCSKKRDSKNHLLSPLKISEMLSSHTKMFLIFIPV